MCEKELKIIIFLLGLHEFDWIAIGVAIIISGRNAALRGHVAGRSGCVDLNGGKDSRKISGGREADGSVKFDEKEVRKVVEFLQSRDIREQALGELIMNFPSVLAYDVETRLEPLFMYVEKELGITGTEFAKEVQRRPSLLGLRADENLAKMVGYLESTGSTREEVVEYLIKTL